MASTIKILLACALLFMPGQLSAATVCGPNGCYSTGPVRAAFRAPTTRVYRSAPVRYERRGLFGRRVVAAPTTSYGSSGGTASYRTYRTYSSTPTTSYGSSGGTTYTTQPTASYGSSGGTTQAEPPAPPEPPAPSYGDQSSACDCGADCQCCDACPCSHKATTPLAVVPAFVPEQLAVVPAYREAMAVVPAYKPLAVAMR